MPKRLKAQRFEVTRRGGEERCSRQVVETRVQAGEGAIAVLGFVLVVLDCVVGRDVGGLRSPAHQGVSCPLTSTPYASPPGPTDPASTLPLTIPPDRLRARTPAI